MRILVVLCALVGYVAAEVGYHYNPPQTSYGVPTQSYTGGSSGNSYNQGAGYQQQSVHRFVQTVPSVSYNYQAVSSAPSGYHSGSGYQGSTSGGYIGSTSGYQGGSSGGYQGGSSGGYQGVSSGGFQGGSSGGYQGVSSFQSGGNGFRASSVVSSAPQYQVSGSSQGNYAANYQSSSQSAAVVQQQGPAQVFKHFYVHAAPEEPAPPTFRQPLVLPAPQKHYKVIFIKTPTVHSSAPQFIPVPTQNEEKTLVYVLSNKAEQAQNVAIPKFEPKPPSKPEVFFIKYNNKEDSHSVIKNIVNDFNAKQPGVVSFSGIDSAESSGAVVSNGNSGSGFGGSSAVVSNGNSGSGFVSSGNGFGGGSSQGLSNGVVSISTVADSGSFNVGGGSSGQESNTISYTGSSEGTESQGSFSSGGQVASVNSFTSQSAPHASYGIPSFRSK